MEEASEEEAIRKRLVPHTDSEEAVLDRSGFGKRLFRSGFNGSFGSGGFDGTGYGDGFETAAIAASVAVTSRKART
ncbi:MAG: hypothetical protein ACLU6Y_14980 [Ruminococcus sp.]